jgi:hypothetical protein
MSGIQTHNFSGDRYWLVIKFVSDLHQVEWFSLGILFFSTNKTDRHDITEILLKVALNTINQTKPKYIHK